MFKPRSIGPGHKDPGLGEETVKGFKNTTSILLTSPDRGKMNFLKEFAGIPVAHPYNNNKINMSLIFDGSSVEIYADNGLSVMTEIFFPNKPYNQISLQSDNKYFH